MIPQGYMLRFIWMFIIIIIIPVHAQMVPEHMHIVVPTMAEPRSIFVVAFLLITTPCYILTFMLLVKRRHTYPIAGRGAWFLISVNVTSLVCTWFDGVVGLIFPLGPPCGLAILMLWLFIGYCISLLSRGWLLVFRLEIMNYMSELEWREYKQKRTIQESSSIDKTPIAGYFYITHRNLTNVRWVGGASLLMLVVLAGSIASEATWDPDIEQMNVWLRERGLPDDDGLRSHFTHDALIDAPRCFVTSYKLIVWVSWMIVVLPFIAWTAYKLQTNTRRMHERTRERVLFYQNERQNFSCDLAESRDLVELSWTKIEFVLFFVSGMAMNISMLVLFAVNYESYPFAGMITSMIVWLFSVGGALRTSFETSRLCELMVGKGSHSSPHIEPYYRLHFILNHPHAFERFLEFLRDEYSSENLLFYMEAKNFTSYCLAEVEATATTINVKEETKLKTYQNSLAVYRDNRINLPSLDSVSRGTNLLLHQSLSPPPSPSCIVIEEKDMRMRTEELRNKFIHARSWALRIYDSYLKPHAMFEVNIDGKLNSLINSRIEELKASSDEEMQVPLSSLYTQVANDLFELMEQDSFRRFILTCDFAKLLLAADEMEATRLRDQPDDTAQMDHTIRKADLIAKSGRLMIHQPTHLDIDRGIITIPGTV